MKIIGGHDYYDGAGLGVDETVLFLRKEEIRLDSPFTLPSGVAPPQSRRPFLKFFHVLVGGEVIPGLRERADEYRRRRPDGGLEWVQPDDQLHYDLDSARAAYKRYKEAVAERRLFSGRRNVDDALRRHFETRATPAWTSWMIENRVITGYVYRERRYDQDTGRYITNHVLEANIDRLADLEFYRVLDPATAHMRIASYIGGVLPSGPATIELSDRSRLLKAGFDDKESFRTPKGTKKPRRARA